MAATEQQKQVGKRLRSILTDKGIVIDRIVNFLDYTKNGVKIKLSGDKVDEMLAIRQGDPFNPRGGIDSQIVVDAIEREFFLHTVTTKLSYTSAHPRPMIIITVQC